MEQPEFWNAVNGDHAIADALSPVRRPDPCSVGDLELALDLARGATARASSELPGRGAALAIDGLFDTLWNADAGPPQWIEVDLGSKRTVEQIRLLVAQDPGGRSQHVVSISGEGGDWRRIAVLDSETADGDSLLIEPDRPLDGVRHVRVETTALAGGLAPAWREIAILGR